MRIARSLFLVFAASLPLAGCYDPGYGYVRNGDGGDAYYGEEPAPATIVTPGVYDPGYGYYDDGPACCYSGGVGIGTVWYRSDYDRRYGRRDWHGHPPPPRGGWNGHDHDGDHRPPPGGWHGDHRPGGDRPRPPGGWHGGADRSHPPGGWNGADRPRPPAGSQGGRPSPSGGWHGGGDRRSPSSTPRSAPVRHDTGSNRTRSRGRD